MSDASLAMQESVRERLVNASALTDRVPASNILDSHSRPEVLPCVIIGEGYTAFEDFHAIAFLDLHVWTKEEATVANKRIAGAIRDALKAGPWAIADHICHDMRMERARFMREPDEMLAHGVLTIRAIVQETA